MSVAPADPCNQIARVEVALDQALGEDLIALYLHGSAVHGGLGPRSDLDLLAVTRGRLTPDQRETLLESLLEISAPHPAPASGPRSIELFVFAKEDLTLAAPWHAADFVYGEWLRSQLETRLRCNRTEDPEHAILLSMARRKALVLHGPPSEEMLPEIDMATIRSAMVVLIPTLLATLEGDERNVLLTLARIWRTAALGDFLSKDAAAAWALARMPAPEARTLAYALQGYRTAIEEDWQDRHKAARDAANLMRRQAEALLG
jgi:hypothetical protein